MKLHPSESALLTQLAASLDTWTKTAASTLANPSTAEIWSERTESWARLSDCLAKPEEKAAFQEVVRELMSGLLHSALVTLDGGSALAETTMLTIQDDDGHEFISYLNEYWPQFSGALDG